MLMIWFVYDNTYMDQISDTYLSLDIRSIKTYIIFRRSKYMSLIGFPTAKRIECLEKIIIESSENFYQFYYGCIYVWHDAGVLNRVLDNHLDISGFVVTDGGSWKSMKTNSWSPLM